MSEYKEDGCVCDLCTCLRVFLECFLFGFDLLAFIFGIPATIHRLPPPALIRSFAPPKAHYTRQPPTLPTRSSQLLPPQRAKQRAPSWAVVAVRTSAGEELTSMFVSLSVLRVPELGLLEAELVGEGWVLQGEKLDSAMVLNYFAWILADHFENRVFCSFEHVEGRCTAVVCCWEFFEVRIMSPPL